MTLVFTDPLFEKHCTGYHPECPERLQRTIRYLDSQDWFTKLPKGRITAASEDLIRRTHHESVLTFARHTAEEGGGSLDPDTFMSSESYQVALHAAGTAMAAVDQVLLGSSKEAFCLIRPPGHHATRSESMGFCIFNSIAIAANYARDVHRLDRLLIVDFDVHHGNGTQDIFYEDETVHFFSIHRFPFYPGTGTAQETGSGPGLGATLNVPIPFGTTRAAYLEQFHGGLNRSMNRCRPQLILISAGFDAHKDDPIGSLGLELEDFQTMTRWIKEAAAVYSQGRIVSCLEGGYNLNLLPKLIGAHLEVLSKNLPSLASRSSPSASIHPYFVTDLS